MKEPGRSRVRTEFGPEMRFNVEPLNAAPYRPTREDNLERLKGKLLAEQLETVWDVDTNSRIRRAANEAAALAWASGYPLLVFPTLFEEKALRAFEYTERQEHVRRVTRELLAV